MSVRKSLGGGLGIGALAGGAGIDVALPGALGAAPSAAALGLLERAGLGDLASISPRLLRMHQPLP